jgi:hypothetical protein
MTKLTEERDKKLQQLLELGPQLLRGSASETYRTCGNPNCRCHTKGPKHGPHMYVNYKAEDGRTTGYYVRVVIKERVQRGLAAWTEFHSLTKEVADLNKAIMDEENPTKKRKQKAK